MNALKRGIGVILSLSLMLFSLVACAAGNTSANADAGRMYGEMPSASTTAAMVADNIYTGDYAMDDYDMAAPEESGEIVTGGGIIDRKIIKTVDLSMETQAFDELLEKIGRETQDAGGYVEYSSVGGMASEWEKAAGITQSRYASMTVRVPTDKLDAYLDSIRAAGHVLRESTSTQDVTLQYTDVESHKTALLTEQTRLFELMEQADTVEDLISIESRLSEIRYWLEYYESQLRIYDNQIDYTAISLYIDEVVEFTDIVDRNAGLGTRIKNGLIQTFVGIKHGLENLVVWLAVNAVFLVIIAVAVILAVRYIHKRRKANKTGSTQQEPANLSDRQEQEKE